MVSICIPAYNEVAYLGKLLNTISEQTFENLEVLISDDSTNNKVAQLVDGYSNLPLTYLSNVLSLGSPINWNNAIANAKGDIIKIMHHDDRFVNKDCLQQFVTTLESLHYNFVFSNTLVEDANTFNLRLHRIKNLQKIINNPERLFFINEIGAPSCLALKTSIATQINYRPEFVWLVDVVYYYDLFSVTQNGTCVNKPLVITADKAAHQITNNCILNYKLQIHELLLFYNIIKNNVSTFTKLAMRIKIRQIKYLDKSLNSSVIFSLIYKIKAFVLKRIVKFYLLLH